ncbi:MAG: TetR/AcrR family transcriptional regulator [Desulfatibacillaceae bacterium]
MKSKTSNNQIYQAALTVFAKYGYRRTRVEDVAAQLGIAPSTIYRYVPDKQNLYERTVEFGIHRWQARVVEAMADVGDVAERFRVMCKKGFEYLAHDEDLRAVMVQDPTIFPLAPRKVRFPEIDNASIDLIRSLLNEGMDKGVFRRVDPDYTAELLYSIYVMFIIKTYVKSGDHSAAVMFDHGLDLILEGLLDHDNESG